MGRRSRAGDEALGLFVLVVGAFVLAVSLPVLIGFYWPVVGVGLVTAAAVIAVLLFRPGAPAAEGTWERRILTAGGLLFFVVLVVSGIVSGFDARGAEARETAARIRAEAATARITSERERIERETRERTEAAERLRIATERDLEARRTPQDRASIALSILTGKVDDLHSRVCRARRALAPLGREHRLIPEVRAAQHRLRAEEREDLRELRENARGGRMILCCDGMTSPSCECGRSNRRGCCSWHGGICGCEPLPTEITCPTTP